MPPRPDTPPADRRQELLDAALQVFAGKGYHAATNADIARAAGVTPAALYYYFASKEDLFREALAERARQLRPALARLMGEVSAEEPARKLTEVIRGVVAFFSEERTRAVVRIVLAEGPRDPAVSRLWNEQIGTLVAALFPYLEELMASGAVPPTDPRLLFLGIQGPIIATVLLRDLLGIPLMRDVTDDMLVEHLARTTVPAMLGKGTRDA